MLWIYFKKITPADILLLDLESFKLANIDIRIGKDTHMHMHMHTLTTLMTVDSCVFRVNHLHYQPDEYGEDPELVGYEDGDYDHDYHSDHR